MEDEIMILNPLGQIAHNAWHEFAERHPDVKLDLFIIMPNHGHVLLWLKYQLELAQVGASDEERAFGNPITGSLSTLIGA